MKNALLLSACLASLPALAFEGVIDMKMTSNLGSKSPAGQPMSANGTMSLAIKGLSSRMDMTMQLPQLTTPMKTTVIHRASEPNVTYLITEANKTYRKIDNEPPASAETSKWTVKKLGRETVAGRTTEHVTAKREGEAEDSMELWIDTKLVAAADLEKALNTGGRQGDRGWWKALKDAGVEGVPLKMVMDKGQSHTTTVEATSVQAKSVPASQFELPAGYTESKGGPGAGALTPQQRQEMMKSMMDRLSPEQRQRMEEMMKQRGGGQ